MRILAYNCGHDASAALIDEETLIYSLEGEKGDGPRHSWSLPPTLIARSLQLPGFPDAIAISGFHRPSMRSAHLEDPCRDNVEAGYYEEGPAGKIAGETLFAGKMIRRFSSSHVRSHIMCSYGLSPFPQGQPCYVLVWEGRIGAFYFIDEHVVIRKVGEVINAPGSRYSSIYGLANPIGGGIDEAPGKIMALAAYGRPGLRSVLQQRHIDQLFSCEPWTDLFNKTKFLGSHYFNIGVESQDFKDLAWHVSVELFDRFYQFAKTHVTRGMPLLIAGGCGLNCDWNTRWQQCGLFSDVFVPPCVNDSGVSIGAAVDALHHYTGAAKIEWSVYSGDPFIEDVSTAEDFISRPLVLGDVCQRLRRGDVIAWVQGRYEIGPRALGNRSLLAAPFSIATRDKLNRIKQREAFRPIAPVCLEEDFPRHFEHHRPSPHMLYFQKVKSPELAAITHVDGSARAQSVNEADTPTLHALLREFRREAGVGVLCNTSLNFKGFGFINHMSHLFLYARQRGLDGFVVGDRFFEPQHATLAGSPPGALNSTQRME